jgi:hypothetical protein
MNCKKIKNLIRECEDIERVRENPQIASHLSECSACRSFLDYEISLRSGFRELINEPLPKQLAEKILQIPAQQKAKPESGWFDNLAVFWHSFPIKTAFASCVVGFLAAIMLFSGNREEPGKIIRLKKARVPVVSPPNKSRKQKSVKLTESDLAESETVSPTVMLSEAPQASEPLLDERIPGAVSFSIAEEPEQKSDLKDQIALISSSEGVESRALKKSVRADGFLPMKSEQREQPLQEALDPRIKELEKILSLYVESLETGPIQISDLQARGIIPAEKQGYFLPPPGMTWKIQVIEPELKIILINE